MERLTPLQCYLVSLNQKKYFVKKLKEEFGTISHGVASILFERYGSYSNPGATRISVEVGNE